MRRDPVARAFPQADTAIERHDVFSSRGGVTRRGMYVRSLVSDGYVMLYALHRLLACLLFPIVGGGTRFARRFIGEFWIVL